MTKIRKLGYDGKNPFIEATKEQLMKTKEQQEQHKTSEFVEQHGHKLDELPFHAKHEVAYRVSIVAKYFGHGFSILLASVVGFLLGNLLFKNLDFELTTVLGVTVTFASFITAIFAIIGALLLEAIKSYSLHTYFLDKAKYGKRYISKYIKFKHSIPVMVSLILSFAGGYMAVDMGMGKIERPEFTNVDIDSKVKDLQKIVEFESGLIDKIEATRKTNGRLAHGSDKRRLDSLTQSAMVHSTILIEQRIKWEAHNSKAKGVSEGDHTTSKEQHAQNKLFYALLLALLASMFDVVSLLSIRNIESYVVESLKEIDDLQKVEQRISNNGNDYNGDVSDNEQQNEGNVETLDFEITTDQGMSIATFNGTEFTLKKAKKRLSTYHSKLRNNDGLSTTNEKNIKLFTRMVDKLEALQELINKKAV